MFPLRADGPILDLAISDPLAIDALDSLSHFLNLSIEPWLAPRQIILEAIEKHYVDSAIKPDNDTYFIRSEVVISDEDSCAESGSGDFHKIENGETPIIQYVEWLIADATKKRTSDIHLEPLASRFRIRDRIDGLLVEIENPPRYLQDSIISCQQIIADISIDEKRFPQDGRILIHAGLKNINLRVSTIPSIYGESIVMRILDQESLLRGLSGFGLFDDDLTIF